MKPANDFVGANTRLTWDGPDLMVMRANGMVYSVWTLSDKDRARIAAGGVVHVAVIGNTQPPMRVTVEGLDVKPGLQDEGQPFRCGACGNGFMWKGEGQPTCCPVCGVKA